MGIKNNQSMQLHRMHGSFLIVALVLLILLSSIAVTVISIAFTSNRVSQSYSEYMQAKIKAIGMAEYAKRILETFDNGVYFGPGSCTSTGTCNIINNNFPMNGRPILPWSSGLGSATMTRSSQSDAWWSDHGFAYEESYADGGNARVVVSLLGADPITPYTHTYRIVGYATDSTGTVKATHELFHTWNGYAADPGDGTCAGGCLYGQCCSAALTCGSDQTSCESGSASYVPPGWTCTDYFVNGLGYASSTCANPISPP